MRLLLLIPFIVLSSLLACHVEDNSGETPQKLPFDDLDGFLKRNVSDPTEYSLTANTAQLIESPNGSKVDISEMAFNEDFSLRIQELNFNSQLIFAGQSSLDTDENLLDLRAGLFVEYLDVDGNPLSPDDPAEFTLPLSDLPNNPGDFGFYKSQNGNWITESSVATAVNNSASTVAFSTSRKQWLITAEPATVNTTFQITAEGFGYEGNLDEVLAYIVEPGRLRVLPMTVDQEQITAELDGIPANQTYRVVMFAMRPAELFFGETEVFLDEDAEVDVQLRIYPEDEVVQLLKDLDE